MSATIYPAGPAQVPSSLSSLTSSYQLRALLAIVAIFLFFALYFALVYSLGYLVYLAVMYDMVTVNKLTLLLKVGAIAGAAMLFVFTVKFIFKLKNHTPENRIKLDKKAHPELLQFVHTICKETGAPKPRHIYVDPDVNAYVSFSNMWLSLLLPVRKDLTIGMGLVSCLDLSEFKAVMAHEFGHFAQRSMKIGSYVVSANTIIHDMIFNRDSWDNALDSWRSADLRLSAAAWAITPVIWIIRQTLGLFYSFLNLMHSSLSREMEFNADKVAISITGSEAIVSGLWKLDGGSAAWNTTLEAAFLAGKKSIFSENLYHHNHLALERDAPKLAEALEGLPADPRGGNLFFSSSETSKAGMYSSHPPNDHREKNAKEPFVACAKDTRSPWLLFANPEALQQEMTKLIYDKYFSLKPSKLVPPETLEAFIAAENQGKTLLEEFDNTFEQRFLHIPTEEEIAAARTLTGVGTTNLKALKAELKTFMQPVREIEALMKKAQQIAEGTTTETAFTYKQASYGKKELKTGYEKLHADREALFEKHFVQWDTKFCALHLQHAESLGRAEELWQLYRQHNALNQLFKALLKAQLGVFSRVEQLQERDDVTEGEVSTLAGVVKKAMQDLNGVLKSLDTAVFVPLPNIATRAELKEAIVEGGEFPVGTQAMFQNGGFEAIAGALQVGPANCQRLDQKSLATILLLHHDLREKVG